MASAERIPPEVPEELDRLASAVVDAVGVVRRRLGAGLFEKLYAAALAVALANRGIAFQREASFSVEYDGVPFGIFRPDFLVEDHLIVESKAVQVLHPVHVAQRLTYLKGSGRPLAILVNCNALPLGTGVRRFVNSSALP